MKGRRRFVFGNASTTNTLIIIVIASERTFSRNRHGTATALARLRLATSFNELGKQTKTNQVQRRQNKRIGESVQRNRR